MESILITDRNMFNMAMNTHYDQELVKSVFSKILVNFHNSLRDFTVLGYMGYIKGVDVIPVNNGIDSFDNLVASITVSQVAYFTTNTFVVNDDYPVRVNIDGVCSELSNISPNMGFKPEDVYSILDNYFTSITRFMWGNNINELIPGKKFVISAIDGGILVSLC